MRSTLWLPIALAIVIVLVIIAVIMIPPAPPSHQAGAGKSNVTKTLTEGSKVKPPVLEDDTTSGSPMSGEEGTGTGLTEGSTDSSGTTSSELIADGTSSVDGGASGSLALAGTPLAGQGARKSSDPTGVQGKIQNSQGLALPGATVEVAGAATVTSEVDGRFAIKDLTGETVSLTISKEGYQPLKKEVAVGTDNLIVTLVREGALSGRVINQNNDPIPSAHINIRAKEGIFVRDFNADQNGRFEIENAPNTTVVITASLEGFENTGEASREVPSPNSEEVVLRLKQPMFSISGRVVMQDTQQGVANFKLTARPEHATENSKVLNVSSDGTGFYKFDNVARGTYIVSSMVGDNSQRNMVVPLDQDFKTVRVYDADAANVDFIVVNGSEISGQVVTEGGQPVQGAEVYIAKLGSPKTISAGNGAYRLIGVPVFSANYTANPESFQLQLYANHSQYGSGSSDPLTVQPGERLNNIQIVLRGMSQIQGNVVDANGAAVPDAQVILQDFLLGQTRETQTDPAGSFVFDQISSADDSNNPLQGTHSLEASKEGFGRVRKQIAVTPGQQQTITLTLQAGGSIQGRAVDPSGIGVAGALVTTWLPIGGSVTAVTDPAGVYRLDSLPPGEYDISYRLEGQPPLTGQLYQIPAGSTNADVMMTPSEWIITGTVFNQQTKEPVHQFYVSVSGQPANGRPFMQSRTFNTPDGTYQIAVHEPGQYSMTFSAEGYETQVGRVNISPNWKERQFFNTELPPVQGFGGITGTFMPPPGTALVGVRVVGFRDYPTAGNQFVLDGVPSGVHDLVFLVKEGENVVGEVVGGLSGVSVLPDQVTQIDISYEQLQITRNF